MTNFHLFPYLFIVTKLLMILANETDDDDNHNVDENDDSQLSLSSDKEITWGASLLNSLTNEVWKGVISTIIGNDLDGTLETSAVEKEGYESSKVTNRNIFDNISKTNIAVDKEKPLFNVLQNLPSIVGNPSDKENSLTEREETTTILPFTESEETTTILPFTESEETTTILPFKENKDTTTISAISEKEEITILFPNMYASIAELITINIIPLTESEETRTFRTFIESEEIITVSEETSSFLPLTENEETTLFLPLTENEETTTILQSNEKKDNTILPVQNINRIESFRNMFLKQQFTTTTSPILPVSANEIQDNMEFSENNIPTQFTTELQPLTTVQYTTKKTLYPTYQTQKSTGFLKEKPRHLIVPTSETKKTGRNQLPWLYKDWVPEVDMNKPEDITLYFNRLNNT